MWSSAKVAAVRGRSMGQRTWRGCGGWRCRCCGTTRPASEACGRRALKPCVIISSCSNCFHKFLDMKRMRKPWGNRDAEFPIKLPGISERGQACSVENLAKRLLQHQVVGEHQEQEVAPLAGHTAAVDRRPQAPFAHGEATLRLPALPVAAVVLGQALPHPPPPAA